MTVDVLLVVAGLLLLVGGGEALVRGACGLALLAKMSPALVGLTIVAAGTSMPELVVSIQSALAGSPGVAVGNVVGSNLFNIGAVLGLTALIAPLAVQGNTVRFEWPVMAAAAVLFHGLAWDGTITALDGGLLLLVLVAFVGFSIWVVRTQARPEERDEFGDVVTASFGRHGTAALLLNSGAVFLGIALLAGGSTLLVDGAVGLAQGFGVSETVIGLTIVAAGTSTPELVTSLVAAKRGRADVAVANVIGSNIFNVCGIAGATAVVHDLAVPASVIRSDNIWMIGLTLLLFPLMRSGFRVTRLEGAVLFGAFTVYTGLLLAG